MRENTIIIRSNGGEDNLHYMLHEYVHFLIRNQSQQNYPQWFDEGFAEYLGAARSHRNAFELGRYAEHRLSSLSYSHWIPLEKIVASEKYYGTWTAEQRAMFYAQSWALVHYLQNLPGHRQDLQQYLRLVESGVSSVEAFEQTYKIKMRKMGRSVRAYVRKGRYPGFSIDAQQLLPNFEPTSRQLSREQVSIGLAQVALRGNQLDAAEHWFTIADADEQLRAQAQAGLGDVYKQREDYPTAESHYATAMALAPDDPECQLDVAQYWHRRAQDTQDGVEFASFLKKARIHYVKAWKLDDARPETYSGYGDTYLLMADYLKALEMFEQAENYLPSSLQVRLGLAMAHRGLGQKDQALSAARSVQAWSHGGSKLSKQATAMINELDPAPEAIQQ